MKEYTLAVVGATGMVGRKMLQVLQERKLPVKQYRFFASARSAGTTLRFMDQDYTVEELTETCFDNQDIDIALFSAGGGTSLTFAPIAAAHGVLVIDNSSAWRMDPDVPLIVPEVNAHALAQVKKGIIANPNCSTIQAVVALQPLYARYGIERIVYSTYQAVSGAGLAGYQDLVNGIEGKAPSNFPYPIAGNALPHIDSFLETGYTKEEMKMVHETRKIIGDDSLRITATCVRIPVYHGHSESINVQLTQPYELDDIRTLLAQSPGIIVQDDPACLLYPMPIHAEDKDEVFVGRLRRDDSIANGLNMWVVSDNLRKGAATNAVQIAQAYMEQNEQ